MSFNVLLFRTFFVKSALPIDEELRKEIAKNIKSSQCLEPPVTLFDEAQAKVEQLIAETTYPNFLKSDMYLQCLEVCTMINIFDKYLQTSYESQNIFNISRIFNFLVAVVVANLVTNCQIWPTVRIHCLRFTKTKNLLWTLRFTSTTCQVIFPLILSAVQICNLVVHLILTDSYSKPSRDWWFEYGLSNTKLRRRGSSTDKRLPTYVTNATSHRIKTENWDVCQVRFWSFSSFLRFLIFSIFLVKDYWDSLVLSLPFIFLSFVFYYFFIWYLCVDCVVCTYNEVPVELTLPTILTTLYQGKIANYTLLVVTQTPGRNQTICPWQIVQCK